MPEKIAQKRTEQASPLTGELARIAHATEDVLAGLLPAEVGGPEGPLFSAMRYATLGAGKRIRPFLVVASASVFDVPEPVALRVGAALEMVHSYSLVHDDLPCMDDDDVRRGKAACHVVYGDAIAVLVGDALLPLAFETLTSPATHPDPAVRAELATGLARAAGPEGMVAGQAIDLAAEHQTLDSGEIARLERLKTGALIAFAADAGAILGRAAEPERRALAAYAGILGQAYQIADDLLDAEGDAQAMGKAAHKDAARGKATFISMLGIDQARAQAQALADQAVAHLEPFGRRARLLADLARFVVERGW